MEFGSGAVKITPAHDPNDYESALRNNLPISNMLNDDATITRDAGGPRYANVDRFVARERLREELTALGLFRGSKEHSMTLQVCSRTGDILEPLIRPQWFVRTPNMAERAKTMVVRSSSEDQQSSAPMESSRAGGSTRILPTQELKEWDRWLTDPPDWCVSRQLWWGHRIPAFRVIFNGRADEDLVIQKSSAGHNNLSQHPHISYSESEGFWVVGKDESTATELCRSWLGDVPGIDVSDVSFTLTQDEDVLDTWFSSGLLPLSALGWPGPEFEAGLGSARFYPLSLMETGSDILFFWVARMAMLCTAVTLCVRMDI